MKPNVRFSPSPGSGGTMSDMTADNSHIYSTLNDFEALCRETLLDASDKTEYLFPGLAAEVGELLSKYVKYVRDGGVWPGAELKDELGDILWFVAVCSGWCTEGGFGEVAEGMLKKLKSRAERGTLQGSGDDR